MHTFHPSTHLLSQNLPEHWLGRTVPTLHGMHLDAAALPPWLPLEHHKIPYPCGVDGNPYRHCTCTLNKIIPYPHLPQPLPYLHPQVQASPFTHAACGLPRYSLTLPTAYSTRWHPQISARQQATFQHLIHTIATTIILPSPLPPTTYQTFLNCLRLPVPPGSSQYLYSQLFHRPPTKASLQNGLGSTGKVYIPIDIWRSLHLPQYLPSCGSAYKHCRIKQSLLSHDVFQFLYGMASSHLITLTAGYRRV